MELTVSRLCSAFESDPFQTALKLRNAAREDSAAFWDVASSMLRTLPNGRLQKLLIVLLSQHPHILSRITDTQLPEASAIELVKTVIAADASFLSKFIQLLPEDGNLGRLTLSGPRLLRAVLLLDAVGSPVAVQALRSLMMSGNGRAASKAALSIVRFNHNVDFASHILHESRDRRVRANVIEALWGGRSDTLQELYRRCLNDDDNRVVGNAIVGLWLAGDQSGKSHIQMLASHPSVPHRQTAAWVIGHLALSEFRDILEVLRQDVQLPVRRSAAAAIRKLGRLVVSEPVEEPAEVEAGQAFSQDTRIHFWIDGKLV